MKFVKMIAFLAMLVTVSLRLRAGTLQLHLETNGGGWATITDNGQILDGSGTNCGDVLYQKCQDINPSPSVMEFSTTWLDAFATTTMIGQSKTGDNLLDLSTVTVTAGAGGGTLKVWLSDVGFTSASGSVGIDSQIAATIPAGGQLEFQAYLDNSDSFFGTQTPILADPVWFTGASTGPTAFSFDTGGIFNVGGIYSLTAYACLIMPQDSSLTFSWSIVDPVVSPTPEPSVRALSAAGLIALVLLRNRGRDTPWTLRAGCRKT